MTQLLETIFGELGISHYLDAFLEQGFDTWETILDITESDLDALGVKLGHRRKLQRRIANFRGIAPEASLASPTQPNAEDAKVPDAIKAESPRLDGRETIALVVTKRKYRRHPKPDENAPERPPSAYVLFSNKMREELKGRALSFTEIAKLVGENWQNLSAAEKEPFDSQAQVMKERYLADLAEYKKAPEYRKYQAYLQEFKAKHACPSQEKDASKRVRLSESRPQSRASPTATPGRTSRRESGTGSRRGSEPPTGRQRLGSTVSESQYSTPLTPSVSAVSPDESITSPVVSSIEEHLSDRSPVFDTQLGDLPLLPGRHTSNQGIDQGREQLSTQRHLLPSLSDVLDGQGLPRGIRPSNETNGFRLPNGHVVGSPLGYAGTDPRPAPPANEQHLARIHAPTSSFAQSRTPVDGPLPIHALLASKPEPPFQTNQPPHLHQGNAQYLDQKPWLVHRTPNGAAGLPMVNGYLNGPSLSHNVLNGPSMCPNFNAPSPPSPPSAGVLSRQGKHNASFDGMSALLKAGEIVDRRAQ